MVQYIFAGRLEANKGCKLLSTLFDHWNKNPSKYARLDQCQFLIFGEGTYKSIFLDQAHDNSHIHVFGRKSRDEIINRYAKTSHYALVPSLFYETFGLSALEMLSVGLPVIGFGHGGLGQFIDPEYDISKHKGKSELEKFEAVLKNCTQNFSQAKRQKESDHAHAKSLQYSPETRFAHFQELVGSDQPKKVLMVTDFLNPIGGIETAVYDFTHQLHEQGYDAHIFGYRHRSSWIPSWLKLLGVVLIAPLNIWQRRNLRKTIKRIKPDLIRYHSVLRRLGPWSLLASSGSSASKWLMIHDLGYVTAFPHLLQKHNTLPHDLKWSSFWSTAHDLPRWKKIIFFPGIARKYLIILWLRVWTRKIIDRYLVPSPFLVPVIRDTYATPKQSVDALSLFSESGDKE